jgi:hypothetical protein
MSHIAGDRRSLLQQEDSGISESSAAIPSSNPAKSPTSPRSPILRHGYQRMDSSPDLGDPVSKSSPKPSIYSFFENDDQGAHGLGISDRRTSIQRVPVGSRTSPRAPSNPFTSPLDSPAITEPSRPLLTSVGNSKD